MLSNGRYHYYSNNNSTDYSKCDKLKANSLSSNLSVPLQGKTSLPSNLSVPLQGKTSLSKLLLIFAFLAFTFLVFIIIPILSHSALPEPINLPLTLPQLTFAEEVQQLDSQRSDSKEVSILNLNDSTMQLYDLYKEKKLSEAAELLSTAPRLLKFYPSNLSTLPSTAVDFPCSLRILSSDPKKCTIKCIDQTCSNALTVCNLYDLDCSVIVYPDEMHSDLKDLPLILMHNKNMNPNPNMNIKTIINNNNTTAIASITPASPQTTYVINSYGGCGAKMLAEFLLSLPAQYRPLRVRHILDPNPQIEIRDFDTGDAGDEASVNSNDSRTADIPGGMYSKVNRLVTDEELDNYKFVYIYKDPVESLVSRYSFGRCKNTGGDDCGIESKWPKLDEFIWKGIDVFKIADFFHHWTTKDVNRKYPVICINYHKLWDDIPLLLQTLGLPETLSSSFPVRTETVRNEETSALQGGVREHLQVIRERLKKMFKEVREEMRGMGGVEVL